MRRKPALNPLLKRSNQDGLRLSAVWSGACAEKWVSPASMWLTSVGTRVRDRRYEAIMEKTTASAIGVKRYLAGPVRKTTETNTMQMVSVDTNVGAAISDAPWNTAS